MGMILTNARETDSEEKTKASLNREFVRWRTLFVQRRRVRGDTTPLDSAFSFLEKYCVCQ